MTWDHSLTRLLFVNDTATTGTYTLSLHDALPICEEELDARVHADGVAAIALGRRGVEHLDVRRPALAELSRECRRGEPLDQITARLCLAARGEPGVHVEAELPRQREAGEAQQPEVGTIGTVGRVGHGQRDERLNGQRGPGASVAAVEEPVFPLERDVAVAGVLFGAAQAD